MSVRSTPEDWQTLAKTLYGEARGEPFEGIVAVAWVVVNRLMQHSWYGDSVTGVCLKPWQFSCWNQNDPNRQKIETLSFSDLDYRRCLGVSSLVLAGDLPDYSRKAVSYHVASMSPKPEWAASMIPTVQVGSHQFYREA